MPTYSASLSLDSFFLLVSCCVRVILVLNTPTLNPYSIYISHTTLSDIIPNTLLGRLVGAVAIYLGVVLLSLPVPYFPFPHLTLNHALDRYYWHYLGRLLPQGTGWSILRRARARFPHTHFNPHPISNLRSHVSTRR